LHGLIDAGITLTVSLMEAEERDHAGHAFVDYAAPLQQMAAQQGRIVECCRRSIKDGSIPSVAEMRAMLDRIDDALAVGGIVYVHCWGGRGRTGTVVACWLIRHGLATPDQAVCRLQELTAHNRAAFHPTPENTMQCDFVEKWTKEL
jgi:hypothetical protein